MSSKPTSFTPNEAASKGAIFIIYHTEESSRPLAELFAARGYDPIIINDFDTLLATSALKVVGAIVDISMGGRSAIHAVEIINQMPSGSRIPVLVSCEFPDVESISGALNAGAVDYIIRPYSKLEIWHRMRTIIEEGI